MAPRHFAKTLNIPVGQEQFESILRKSENYRTTGSDSKSSMLVDIENGRQTEIESLHGKLCQLANRAGVATPVNEIIYYGIRLSQPVLAQVK